MPRAAAIEPLMIDLDDKQEDSDDAEMTMTTHNPPNAGLAGHRTGPLRPGRLGLCNLSILFVMSRMSIIPPALIG